MRSSTATPIAIDPELDSDTLIDLRSADIVAPSARCVDDSTLGERPATATRPIVEAENDDGDTVPDLVVQLVREPAPDAPTPVAEQPAPASEGEESHRMTREEAEMVGEYRFRRLQGHQAGCQCQSRRSRAATSTVDGRQLAVPTETEHLGCIELRVSLLAAGFWKLLYDTSSAARPDESQSRMPATPAKTSQS